MQEKAIILEQKMQNLNHLGQFVTLKNIEILKWINNYKIKKNFPGAFPPLKIQISLSISFTKGEKSFLQCKTNIIKMDFNSR